MKATKFDNKKPSFSAIPQLALMEVAKSFTYGANKYGLYNYSGEMEVSRYIDAAFRHLNQFNTGQDVDKEATYHEPIYHLAAVAASAMMALDGLLSGQCIDNRNLIYKKLSETKLQRKDTKAVTPKLVEST